MDSGKFIAWQEKAKLQRLDAGLPALTTNTHEINPMKTQLKLISHLAAIAIACGGLCFSAALRAQSGTPDGQSTPDPDANKKEGSYNGAYPSPTPTPPPKK